MSVVKHAKTSALSDTGDSSLIQPSDFNAEHVTTETDTTKRLAPDGAGGMAWVAGGGATPEVGAAGRIYAYLNFR